MKYISLILLVVSLCVFSGCNGKKGSPADESFGKPASYALGMDVGESMKRDGIYPDLDEFIQGMKDVLYGSKPRYAVEESYQILGEAFTALGEKREAENRKAENEFLAENRKKPGIIETDSGLQYEIITEGNGPSPNYDSTVRVHYDGTLIDGTTFDSTYSYNEPIEFPLSNVISGWTEGLQLMKVGSKYRFFIPADLGYGSQGSGPIPPYSTLIFEVELLDIDPEH